LEDHSKSIRHTPESRIFGKKAGGKSISITTRTRRKQQSNGFAADGHSGYPQWNRNGRPRHRGQKRKQRLDDDCKSKDRKYEHIEMCRHRKLWTDLVGGHEALLSELRFCRDTSYFITSNSIAHKISNIVRLLLTEYFRVGPDAAISILDGLSCIGGNTYSFSKVFASPNHAIYANELDGERFAALEHNMAVFERNGVIANGQRLHFFNLDFLTLHESLGAETCGAIDVVFLDPEWNNGDDYKQTKRGQIHLFDIGPLHLYQAVDRVISEWYCNAKVVAVKVAKNWDQPFIVRKLRKCKLIEDGSFRIGTVRFHNQSLVLIVRTNEDDDGDGDDDDEDEDDDIDIDIAVEGDDGDDDGGKECTAVRFEEIMERLPALTNHGGSNSIRDMISVEVLS